VITLVLSNTNCRVKRHLISTESR